MISKYKIIKVNKNQLDKLIYGFISNENLSYSKTKRRIFNIKLKFRQFTEQSKNWKKLQTFFVKRVESIIADLGSNIVLNYFDKDKTSIFQSENNNFLHFIFKNFSCVDYYENLY